MSPAPAHRFFREIKAAMRLAGQPPEQMMQLLRDAEVKAHPAAGRNDPCPCGSGRKYKKCCLNA